MEVSMSKEHVIVALDFPNEAEAIAMMDCLDDQVSFYKVGLELFLNSGGNIVKEIKARNKSVFLDLKFHDIPNTVAQACFWAASLGVDIVNVHASGGEEMMRKAHQGLRDGANNAGLPTPLLIAVTVLTSMDELALKKVGLESAEEQVLRLATLTQEAGLDGVVCSPKEVLLLKEKLGSSFITVCPGIRPLSATKDDQKRTMTPKEALEQGVDYMVIGRPITRAEDPYQAAKDILAEMA